MMNPRFFCLALFFVAPVTGCSRPAATIDVSDNDWPWWRGPGRDGKSAGASPPTTWDPMKNVVWKSPVPGRGHSSPSIWGERVFVSTADEEEKTQSLVCFDRRTGRQRWNTLIHKGGLEHAHKKNSQASPTAAADGERVYVLFLNGGNIVLSATNLEGDILWQSPVGPFKTEHGYASSPAVYESLVLVSADSLSGSFIAGVDRKTGEVVWSSPREDGPTHGNYAVPMVGVVAGRPQLFIAGQLRVDSYDPRTGERLWYVQGAPAQVVANTMAFEGDFVYVSGGYPEKDILCIRADGQGDVTDSHVVWREKQAITYVPSPVVHEGRLYTVNDGGVATCFDSKNGNVIWRERVGGKLSASPILAGGHLYCPAEDGTTYVLKAGDHFELVASNPLGEGIFATPVICGGQIFLRTHDHLYCIGNVEAALDG